MFTALYELILYIYFILIIFFTGLNVYFICIL